MNNNSNESKWKEIIDTEDIKMLLDAFSFHDACLKELHMFTGHHVNPDLTMQVSVGLDCKVRILFQRQCSNPSAIEMLFEEVTGIHINPSPNNQDSIMFGASLFIEDGVFYWADDSNWNLDDKFDLSVSWISSLKVKWREVSKWMGPDLRYGN